MEIRWFRHHKWCVVEWLRETKEAKVARNPRVAKKTKGSKEKRQLKSNHRVR